MSDIDLGIIGEMIDKLVDKAVERRISHLTDSVIVLYDFENVDVLTLDEVCKIFRCEDKNGKERIRDACKRGELPFVMIGRDYLFPKRQIAEVLLGTWKKGKLNTK